MAMVMARQYSSVPAASNLRLDNDPSLGIPNALMIGTDVGARAQEDRAALPPGAPRVDSTLLFRGEREIVIVHRGQEYRLRITRGDKLILTK
jgi:hemin uptake protein HemP